MNKIILAIIMVSLMVPAYADDLIDDTKVIEAQHQLGECMRKVAQDGRPISDVDKAAFKEALDNFNKEIKEYYQLEDKPKKKHKSAMKILGDGVTTYLNRPRYYGTNMGLGAPNIYDVVTPSGSYPIVPMGIGGVFTVMPNGMPH